jgi:hypothetical protein
MCDLYPEMSRVGTYPGYKHFYDLSFDTQMGVIRAIKENINEDMNIVEFCRRISSLIVKHTHTGFNCFGVKEVDIFCDYVFLEIFDREAKDYIEDSNNKILEKGPTLRQGNDQRDFYNTNKLFLDSISYRDLVSLVSVDNTSALKFTEKFGFKRVAVIKNQYDKLFILHLRRALSLFSI